MQPSCFWAFKMHWKYTFKFSSQLERLEACLFEKKPNNIRYHGTWNRNITLPILWHPRPPLKTRTAQPTGIGGAGAVSQPWPQGENQDSLGQSCLFLETENHSSYCSQRAVTKPHYSCCLREIKGNVMKWSFGTAWNNDVEAKVFQDKYFTWRMKVCPVASTPSQKVFLVLHFLSSFCKQMKMYIAYNLLFYWIWNFSFSLC